MSPIEQLTIVAIRILALLSSLFGVVMGIIAMLQTWGQVDLTYIDLFLRTRLVSPLVFLLAGILLFLFSRKIARRLLQGLPLE